MADLEHLRVRAVDASGKAQVLIEQPRYLLHHPVRRDEHVAVGRRLGGGR
jgi:hypothetical protein